MGVSQLKIGCLRTLALVAMLIIVPVRAQTQDFASRSPALGLFEQLIAPIALYPHTLFSRVLMAPTYPLEVVEAVHGSSAFSGGGRGGGRRSDATLKHDIVLLGYLDNGLGFYRFAYNGSETVYVGVMAQEVQAIMPEAVIRGRDGFLQVFYDKLGVRFQTYDEWAASGARVPTGSQKAQSCGTSLVFSGVDLPRPCTMAQ